MKTKKLFFISLILGLITFASSCKKDDNSPNNLNPNSKWFENYLTKMNPDLDTVPVCDSVITQQTSKFWFYMALNNSHSIYINKNITILNNLPNVIFVDTIAGYALLINLDSLVFGRYIDLNGKHKQYHFYGGDLITPYQLVFDSLYFNYNQSNNCYENKWNNKKIVFEPLGLKDIKHLYYGVGANFPCIVDSVGLDYNKNLTIYMEGLATFYDAFYDGTIKTKYIFKYLPNFPIEKDF